MIENLDGPVVQNGIGKEKHGHIGPSPRSIDRKKAQTYGLDAIEVAVGISHQLIALLRGRIKADGMVHLVLRCKRHFVI